MREKPSLGFVGLGNMGLPMSKNLITAGYQVYGLDINEKAVEAFQQEGGNIGPSLEAISDKVDIIMTSLPSPQVVENTYLGEDGIIAHAQKDLLMIDFSTVSPEVNEKIAKVSNKQGLGYLGTPVSGGVVGAENQTLTMMVGGDKLLYNQAYPILNVLGGNIFHVGEEPGSGTVVKLLNNLFIGFYTQAVGEVLTLADKAGMDHDKLFDILEVSYGQSRIYERNYKTFISQNNYEPGFTTKLLLKDLRLARQMAKENQVHLPIMGELISMYEEAAESGYSDQDMSSMYLHIKDEVQHNLHQKS
ncbi:NAD(P)-dependent oxidoreductase [Virgibacillus natechei]|uniref:NAD(P)-dependent oxidoreductase n=1 Tax=Virgibacillus sp. CBA3643 TaxID=2942278 RepID=UPI0035A2DC21